MVDIRDKLSEEIQNAILSTTLCQWLFNPENFSLMTSAIKEMLTTSSQSWGR